MHDVACQDWRALLECAETISGNVLKDQREVMQDHERRQQKNICNQNKEYVHNIFVFVQSLSESHDLGNLEQWIIVTCNHEIVRTFTVLQ